VYTSSLFLLTILIPILFPIEVPRISLKPREIPYSLPLAASKKIVILTAFQTMSCLADSEQRPDRATLPKAADILQMARCSNSNNNSSSKNKAFGVMGTILGECLCEPFPSVGDNGRGMSQSDQFIELHGIEFIGLGAVADELTARERVYDTLQQLTSRTERLISIGYLVDQEQLVDGVPATKVTETIPLDVWSKTYPNDKNMPQSIKAAITSIKVRMRSKDCVSQSQSPSPCFCLLFNGISFVSRFVYLFHFALAAKKLRRCH
jgi:hypothetical protein